MLARAVVKEILVVLDSLKYQLIIRAIDIASRAWMHLQVLSSILNCKYLWIHWTSR